jgi:hypothetical protein
VAEQVQVAVTQYGQLNRTAIVAAGERAILDKIIEDWGRFINVLARAEIRPLSEFKTINESTDRAFILITVGDNGERFQTTIVSRGHAGSTIEWLPGEMAALPDYFLELARGTVTNASIVNRFGLRTGLLSASNLPADVWNGPRADFPWPVSPIPLFISSDNAGDTSAVRVVGLDGNLDPLSVDVTLQGQTKTPIGTTEQFRRLHRVFVLGPQEIIGVARVYADDTVVAGVPQTPAKIGAVIDPLHQQSLSTMHTVPNGANGYLLNWFASVNSVNGPGAREADVVLQIREPGGVFRTQSKLSPNNTGGGIQRIKYDVPRKYPSGTDFRIRVTQVSVDNTEVTAGYDLIIVGE